MNELKSRYAVTKKVLVFWTLFIGLGAVWGSVCMLIDPTGRLLQMDAMLPYFKKLPFADILFRDYIFSGISLLIVNGITNLTATVFLLLNKKSGVVLGGVFGVTLMLWICIQFYMFPPNILSTAYFIFGTAQAVTGYITYIFRKQEEFTVNTAEYKNIGTDKSRLVVFFSRMGYVKKIAYEYAEKSDADIYKIKATEKTDGTPGFWWCGRYGMHRWDMPIENIGIDLSAYNEVTVCSPIWVFSLAAPIRAFLRQASGKIKSANYIFVHHTAGRYQNAAKEADTLLGMVNSDFADVVCRKGRFRQFD